MAKDRWMSFVNIFPKDITLDEFIDGLTPTRKGELFVTSRIRHGEVEMRHVTRRSADEKEESYVSAYLSLSKDPDGDGWGLLIDAKGNYPRRISRDILGAIGLDFDSFSSRLDIVNPIGINLNTGRSIYDDPTGRTGIRGWAEDGTGFLFVITALSGGPVKDAEIGKYLPGFFGAVTPVVTIDDTISQEGFEEDMGVTLRPDSVTVIAKLPGDPAPQRIGSFSRQDKVTGRRIAGLVHTYSTEIMDAVSDLLSIPKISVPSASKEEKDDDSSAEIEELQRRVSDLERTNRTLSKEKRGLAKEVYALSRIDRTEIADIDDLDETPQEPVIAAKTEAQSFTEQHCDDVFESFADLHKYAYWTLKYVTLSPGAADDIEDVQSDKRSSGWRAFTWMALLALNEYGEALNNGTYAGNIYEFLRQHTHPPVSPRRAAMRESDTVRTNPKLMALRTFDVQGEKVPMEAHFKIDASGKHPAPRMHFTTIDGRVHVGYIGRHLRNQSTN